MTPLTYELRPSVQEISACHWMSLHELETCREASAVTKHVFRVVRHGLANGFDKVLIGCSSRQRSLYRDRTFDMYSMLAKLAHNEDCVHDVVDAPD